jgi:hypothetical protein
MARKKIPPFNPKQSPIKTTTLARQVARQNLSTLNNALWVTERSYSIVKSAFTMITWPMGVKVHGRYGSEEQWSAAVDEQRLWVRQHVLVSAASLLEVYLATVISEVLWASPELADRSLLGVREIELIKFSDRASGLAKLVKKHVKVMLTGEWNERFRQMAITFGRLPTSLDALAPKLQDLQDKRNRIAHGFGQRGKAFRRTPWEPTDAIKLEVSDIEEALTCVNEVIREADVHVFAPIIGGYEFLFEYDTWLKGLVDPYTRPSPDLREQAFRHHVQKKFGHGQNKKYYQSMIQYYDACL